ncbi:MAG: non-ribosomal peptide synthetase, partial [Ruminococcus sp.]|nr:non-ribosomal peptide synthetase [Ruminococcus sp.]
MQSAKEILLQMHQRGITLWCENENIRYKAPENVFTQEDLNLIRENKQEILHLLKEIQNSRKIEKNEAERYEKFDLTAIQNSYVRGRDQNYELSGIGCHGYIEITYDEVIEQDKFIKAWNQVIAKHDMLRAVIYPEGFQKVQETVPEVQIPFFDLRNQPENAVASKMDEIRSELAQKQYPLGVWPLFDLKVTIHNEHKSIIHFSLDMLVCDFISSNIILNDLEAVYHNRTEDISKPETLFRDYISYKKTEEAYQFLKKSDDEAYWDKKIEVMGEAPELPVLDASNYGEEAEFDQYKIKIPREKWNQAESLAKKYKITPSMLIFSAYAHVLSYWSKSEDFCVNITLLNRPELSSDIGEIVGDFTEVNVADVKIDPAKSFLDNTITIQKNMWEDLSHNAFSGIEVLRKMSKVRKKNVIIPVVYTSTVGIADRNAVLRNQKITYKISQTPQVWIDCQAEETQDEITVNWDVRKGIFNYEVVEDMFESLTNLLNQLCTGEEAVLQEKKLSLLPPSVESVRTLVNQTEKD